MQQSSSASAQVTSTRPSYASANPAQNVDTIRADPLNVADNELKGKDRSIIALEPDSGAQQPISGSVARHERAPVRIRRNAWQTMQEHLGNTVKAPGSNQHREGASAPDLVSSSKSQAITTSASIPAPPSHDKALDPSAPPPPSNDSVPSLLLRLSDPLAPRSVDPQNTTASDGHRDPGSGRETLSAPQGDRPVSVAGTVARTRARPARTSAGEDRSAAASQLRPPTQHPGPAGRDSTAKPAAGGTGDVRASSGAPGGGHMSSASEEISVRASPRRGQSATLFCQFASPASCRGRS